MNADCSQENLFCEFQPEYEYELFLNGGDFLR